VCLALRFPYLTQLHAVCLSMDVAGNLGSHPSPTSSSSSSAPTQAMKGCLALVLEYFPRSLHDCLRSEIMLDWPFRWRIALQVSKALNHLHNHKLLHRDLSSSTIMLTDDLHVHLNDYGLTVTKIQEQVHQTNIASPFLVWTAPELLMSTDSRYTDKCDIYSFGIVLWEIASRTQPFENMNPQAIVEHVKQGRRLPIPEECPQSFYDLMCRCWAPKAEDRPTIGEIIELIENVDGLPSSPFPSPSTSPGRAPSSSISTNSLPSQTRNIPLVKSSSTSSQSELTVNS